MRNVKHWIEDYWDNIISIAGLLVFALVLVLIYVFVPRLLNVFLLNRLDAETTSTVLSIEKEMVMHEDHLGGRVRVGGFTIKYQYNIEDSTYQKEEYVDRKSIDRDAELFLLHLNSGDTISVKYNPNEPSVARWLPKTSSNN
ncbi:MAG: DUF3592 domain-containing protein [Bacteroidota bacterium]